MSLLRNSTIAAFSEEHAERLTGVTRSQLRYWDRTDFFAPTYAETNRRVPFSRVYSFRDIVALRVLNVLRNQYSVPLHHLRKVSKKLSHLAEDKWTRTKLYVLNRKVIWIEPDTKLPQEIASAQYVVPMVLGEVMADTERDVVKLNKRDERHIGKVTRSRYVNHNLPVLSGTRIPVSAIQSFADAGYTPPQIVAEYPDLTEEDVSAALRYNALGTALGNAA